MGHNLEARQARPASPPPRETFPIMSYRRTQWLLSRAVKGLRVIQGKRDMSEHGPDENTKNSPVRAISQCNGVAPRNFKGAYYHSILKLLLQEFSSADRFVPKRHARRNCVFLKGRKISAKILNNGSIVLNPGLSLTYCFSQSTDGCRRAGAPRPFPEMGAPAPPGIRIPKLCYSLFPEISLQVAQLFKRSDRKRIFLWLLIVHMS